MRLISPVNVGQVTSLYRKLIICDWFNGYCEMNEKKWKLNEKYDLPTGFFDIQFMKYNKLNLYYYELLDIKNNYYK